MSSRVKKDINGTIPQVKKNIKVTIPRVNKDIKVLRDEPKIKKYQNDDEPESQDQISPLFTKNINVTIPQVNKDIKVLRDEPKIKKYQSDDEPKSQDQMSLRVKKDIKSIKRRTQNKKNIKVMMNQRAKIKCHPGSKKISTGRYPRSIKISKC